MAQGSVIVYVWRQRDAEVVAESIQASGVSGGVVHYHGGMDSGSRSNAYSKVRPFGKSKQHRSLSFFSIELCFAA